MVKVLEEKETYVNEIQSARKRIADLKHEKINLRAKSWADAEGIADAKKDFVRSIVSDLDLEISKLGADIEYYYNMIKITDYRLENE